MPHDVLAGKTSKVYLSGPMKGYPQSNFPAFHEAARRLRSAGFDVVNPAEINVKGAESDADYYNQCMRADIRAMCDCDGIVMLPGWERSNGAHIELHLAHRLGFDVLFYERMGL